MRATESEQGEHASEDTSERDESAIRQSKTKRKKGRAFRANESEQGEHASEDTSERHVSAKGK